MSDKVVFPFISDDSELIPPEKGADSLVHFGPEILFPRWAMGQIMYFEVTDNTPEVTAGSRGHITYGPGVTMYDWHREVSLNGFGVPWDKLAVLERRLDGSLKYTQYKEWLEYTGLRVNCLWCGQDLLKNYNKPCSVREKNLEKIEKEELVIRRSDRKKHARKAGNIKFALVDTEPAEKIKLHIASVKLLSKLVREYDFDYEDFIIYQFKGSEYGVLYANRRKGFPFVTEEFPVIDKMFYLSDMRNI
ncbi:MAG: hypothetical protein JXR95_02280 [Deltaproteobacteria bacterium]|nr:hypothetical protein [Deltaproteobacteria bacterium]